MHTDKKTAPSKMSSSLRGQSVVELAAVFALLVPIFVGCIDLGRAYFAYDVLAHAVNEGVRIGTFDSNTANVVAVVHDAAVSIGLPSENVNVTCYSGSSTTTIVCSSMAAGDSVKVDASIIFMPVTPWLATVLPGGSLTLASTARRTFQ